RSRRTCRVSFCDSGPFSLCDPSKRAGKGLRRDQTGAGTVDVDAAGWLSAVATLAAISLGGAVALSGFSFKRRRSALAVAAPPGEHSVGLRSSPEARAREYVRQI